MVLGNHTEIWNDIKEQIRSISGNKVIKYGKDFMKIKFESNDDLPISKIINIPACVIKIKILLFKFSSCVKCQLQCDYSFLRKILLFKFSSCVKYTSSPVFFFYFININYSAK